MIYKLLGVLGVIIIITGFVFSFNIFMHSAVVIALGWLFLMLFLNKQYFNVSNYGGVRKKLFFPALIIVGALAAVVIEYVGLYISPAWVYAYNFFDPTYHFWLAIALYVTYPFAAYETFVLVRNILGDYKREDKTDKTGLALSLACLVFIIFPFVFESVKYPGLPFEFFIAGLFALSDIINYRVTGRSVITRSLADYRYLVAFLLTTLTMAVISEYANIISYAWRYINIPWLETALLGVPVIILVGWIPLVGMWVNFFEAIKKSVSKKVGL